MILSSNIRLKEGRSTKGRVSRGNNKQSWLKAACWSTCRRTSAALKVQINKTLKWTSSPAYFIFIFDIAVVTNYRLLK